MGLYEVAYLRIYAQDGWRPKREYTQLSKSFVRRL